MIVASSPCRVSLSSIDHSPFAERFGGNALNFAINKRIYIFLRQRNPLEEFKFRVSYSETELVNSVEEIKHSIVREALKMTEIDTPMEIIYSSDVPVKCGLASSSAMATALLQALFFYRNIGISKELLFDYAYQLERVKAKIQGGFQDFSNVFGNFSYLEGKPHEVTRTPITLSLDKAQSLREHMTLIYVDSGVNSGGVLNEQLSKLTKGETLEEAFKLKTIVKELYCMLTSKDFDPIQLIGPINEAWSLKKGLSSAIAPAHILEFESFLKGKYNNIGFRLIGAGGRGLVLIIADPTTIKRIEQDVGVSRILDFDFDCEGVKVTKLFC